ncbi:unnamed protein product, partial [Symbiodinium sp. KB8]
MNGKKRKRVESNEIVRGPTMCFRQKQQARILSGLRFLKVIATLVLMALDLPCFDADCSLDHFEVFAGVMSVTNAETKDSFGWVELVVLPLPMMFDMTRRPEVSALSDFRP